MKRALSAGLGAAIGASVALGACTKDSRPPAVEGGGTGGAQVGGGTADLDGGLVGDGGVSSLCVEPNAFDRAVATRTIYVGPVGSDSADGTTPATAWRSLRNASTLEPGDHVLIAAGTYPCGVRLTKSGTADAPIVIRSDGDLGAPLFQCGGEESAFLMAGVQFVALQGLAVDGALDDGVAIEGAAHVRIASTRIARSGRNAVRVAASTDVELIGNVVSENEVLGPREDAAGIALRSVERAFVFRNVFDRITSDIAVDARAGSRDIVVDGNRFDTVLQAVRLGSVSAPAEFAVPSAAFEVSGGLVANNVVRGAVEVPFEVRGCEGCVLAFNTVYGQGVTAFARVRNGGAGPLAPSSASVPSGIEISSTLFVSQGSPPAVVVDGVGVDADTIALIRNGFFATAGSMLAAPSTPPFATAESVVDQDPLFVDAVASDFRLQEESPMRNAGQPRQDVRRDGTGGCRSRFNIGAL